MNPCLNKLGISLVAMFAFCFLALVGEISFVLLRRRIFKRRRLPDRDLEVGANKNKEIFGFLCCLKNKSRIEPKETPPPANHEREGDDEMKWQEMYRSSGVLFTIREESECEGIDSENCSSSEKEVKERKGSICVMVSTVEEKATPFETPCSSPPYYTPHPSPACEFHSHGIEIAETTAWK